MNLLALKNTLLDKYHAHLHPFVQDISQEQEKHQDKARMINRRIAEYYQILAQELGTFHSTHDRQQAFIVLQYCTSVVSLEYRHRVWPYEYMAFSRRVGELWEKFCSAAWAYPSRNTVTKIAAPSFRDVEISIRTNIRSYISSSPNLDKILEYIDILFGLIGDINMREDVVCTVDNTPYVIDFKSGFGSNEKGNTYRLLSVGRAYKLWNPDTRLYLLVRQQENNSYLNVIKRSGLWDVYLGEQAYEVIDSLTGSDIRAVRESVVDFSTDLSHTFWTDVSSHLTDLSSYLRW